MTIYTAQRSEDLLQNRVQYSAVQCSAVLVEELKRLMYQVRCWPRV